MDLNQAGRDILDEMAPAICNTVRERTNSNGDLTTICMDVINFCPDECEFNNNDVLIETSFTTDDGDESTEDASSVEL